MGYCYYLRRDDNRTLFELGKHVGDWGEVLGEREPIVLTHEHEATLAAWLAHQMRSDGGWKLPDVDGYARHCAREIVRWADGQPFRFIGEDGYDDWDDGVSNPDFVTGTRFIPPTLPERT